jgi:hypothetical protein
MGRLLWAPLAWLLAVLLWLLPVGAWCAWWLWAVNWKKAWPVLAQGAWVPVVLLTVLGALAWAQAAPTSWQLGGLGLNFWWQLGGAGALVALALFCGWLQGWLGWGPEEVSYESAPPAEAAHGHH